MNASFAAIVEEVQKLSTEEKEKLQILLAKYLVEARREEICQNYLDSKKRAERGELKFSNDVDELRKTLYEQSGYHSTLPSSEHFESESSPSIISARDSTNSSPSSLLIHLQA
jgi:hypothetical protein